jgi:hypothetical protein
MRTLLASLATFAVVVVAATVAACPAIASPRESQRVGVVAPASKRAAACPTTKSRCRGSRRARPDRRSRCTRRSRRSVSRAKRTARPRTARARRASTTARCGRTPKRAVRAPSPTAGPATPAAGPASPTAGPSGSAPAASRGTISAGSGPASPGRLFAAGSVWNAPLGNTAALDPSSPIRMAAFNTEIEDEITTGIGPWISETSYSTPIYTVPANQPKFPVVLDTGSWGNALRKVLDQGVPIPPDAQPAAGTDGHMTIYQPSTDTLWEFWKAVKLSDGWHASWGGAMRGVSHSPGYYSNTAWTGLSASEGWNWGSTATSLPVVAGTVTIRELQRGRIDHALALAIPDACGTTFTWPAQRTDGAMTTADCLPEGAHLRLDPKLDVSTLNLPRVTRILAEAAQRYGVIVRDRTHHATGFYAEDPSPTGEDPYSGPDGLYGGLRPWSFLPQFPWDRLQLLKMTLCTSAPCLPATQTGSMALRRRGARR